jgi:hypothetical protein
MNAMSVMGMDFAAMSFKTKLLFCCWLMRISLVWFLHMEVCFVLFELVLDRLTPPAHLLRNVPEKADDFPFGVPPDHPELPSFVACQHGFSRSMRKALVFFRPITQRIEGAGASLRLSKGDLKPK